MCSVSSSLGKLARIEESRLCVWGPSEYWLTHAVERYFELLKDAKVKGYLFAQTHYIEKQ